MYVISIKCYKFYCQLPMGAFQRQVLIVQVIKKRKKKEKKRKDKYHLPELEPFSVNFKEPQSLFCNFCYLYVIFWVVCRGGPCHKVVAMNSDP